jgi:aspartyl-tRNA(Asn)/glutamyl-tRNA(Gln) amidotransferase subunit A
MVEVNAHGGIVPPEAFMLHRDRLARRGTDIDPTIRHRIARGGEVAAADYIAMLQRRTELVRAMDAALAEQDAFIWPATPIVAPTLAAMSDPVAFAKGNALLLRNTAIVNFFDLCAIALPLPGEGLPCGLMLVGRHGSDRRLLRMAAAEEALFAAERSAS